MGFLLVIRGTDYRHHGMMPIRIDITGKVQDAMSNVYYFWRNVYHKLFLGIINE
jgi:hypothetical protein